MKHIMVDLETRGSVPGCAIISIGMVAFCPETKKLDKGLYVVVLKESCDEVFLGESADTMAWWAKQSPEARKVLELSESRKSSVPLRLALDQSNAYIKRFGGKKEARVWGNGADFDNGILQVAHEAARVPPGWQFWNNRCYRTVKNLAPDIKLERVGTYHNALDDARSQAQHLLQIVEATGLTLN